MDRFEHCMVEFYWTHPNAAGPSGFKPAFTIFHADGRKETHQGANVEVTAALNRLGAEGWRVSSATTSANWILWTLERKLA